MDNHLLERAKELGVCVVEDAYVSDLIMEGGVVRGIQAKLVDGVHTFNAPITIDATGRTRALVRRVDPKRTATRKRARPSLVAFKAHLERARPEDGVCEIYSYRGGYGGLNRVEGDRSNLCFIASAKDVRRYVSDPEEVLRQIVCKNKRAQYTLQNARAVNEWLGVSLETFGRQRLVPTEGLLTIGDAAAFIDPFTGSGMLMALESGELAARAIISELENLKNGASLAALTNRYRAEYAKRFDSRLRVSSFLRRAAFVPRFAEVAILLLGTSDRLRHRLARGTRGQQFRERM
jgi:flavin-dependent dehydrogenase